MFKETSLIVLERQGPSLAQIVLDYKFKFSLEILSILAVRLVYYCLYQIYVLERMHNHGILHSFLSPENIVIGRKLENSKIYLIDLKHSTKILEGKTTVIEDENFHQTYESRGVNEFSSLSKCLNITLSKKDDLESMIYCLMFIYNGGRLMDKPIDKTNRAKSISDHILWKNNSGVQDICKNMPECFSLALAHIRAHNPLKQPDYKFLKKVFTKNIPSNQQMISNNLFIQELLKVSTAKKMEGISNNSSQRGEMKEFESANPSTSRPLSKEPTFYNEEWELSEQDDETYESEEMNVRMAAILNGQINT